MRCYNHANEEGVGICSVCNKVVCKKCVGEDDPRIVCRTCLKRYKEGARAPQSAPSRAQPAVAQMPVAGRPIAQAPMRPERTERLAHHQPLFNKIFTSGKRLPVSDRIDIDVITPVLLFGIICGIATGIPLLSILFALVIPVFAILVVWYMRAEEEYEVFIGLKKGAVAGALMGLVAAFVSLIMIVSLETMFADRIYVFLSNSLAFLDESTFNIVLSLSGADRTLSFSVIIMRAAITFVLFPLIGALFGASFAKILR